jgi:hypothetical protein
MTARMSLACVWLAACAPPPAPPAAERAPAEAKAPEAERPAAPPRGVGLDANTQLVVTHVFTQPPAYIEGSQSFVALHRDGRLLHAEQFRTSTDCDDGVAYCKRTTWDLPPGEYRVSTYEMVCSANCGHLDHSQDACRGHVTLQSGVTTRVTALVTPQGGCNLVVR